MIGHVPKDIQTAVLTLSWGQAANLLPLKHWIFLSFTFLSFTNAELWLTGSTPVYLCMQFQEACHLLHCMCYEYLSESVAPKHYYKAALPVFLFDDRSCGLVWLLRTWLQQCFEWSPRDFLQRKWDFAVYYTQCLLCFVVDFISRMLRPQCELAYVPLPEVLQLPFN